MIEHFVRTEVLAQFDLDKDFLFKNQDKYVSPEAMFHEKRIELIELVHSSGMFEEEELDRFHQSQKSNGTYRMDKKDTSLIQTLKAIANILVVAEECIPVLPAFIEMAERLGTQYHQSESAIGHAFSMGGAVAETGGFMLQNALDKKKYIMELTRSAKTLSHASSDLGKIFQNLLSIEGYAGQPLIDQLKSSFKESIYPLLDFVEAFKPLFGEKTFAWIPELKTFFSDEEKAREVNTDQGVIPPSLEMQPGTRVKVSEMADSLSDVKGNIDRLVAQALESAPLKDALGKTSVLFMHLSRLLEKTQGLDEGREKDVIGLIQDVASSLKALQEIHVESLDTPAAQEILKLLESTFQRVVEPLLRQWTVIFDEMEIRLGLKEAALQRPLFKVLECYVAMAETLGIPPKISLDCWEERLVLREELLGQEIAKLDLLKALYKKADEMGSLNRASLHELFLLEALCQSKEVELQFPGKQLKKIQASILRVIEVKTGKSSLNEKISAATTQEEKKFLSSLSMELDARVDQIRNDPNKQEIFYSPTQNSLISGLSRESLKKTGFSCFLLLVKTAIEEQERKVSLVTHKAVEMYEKTGKKELVFLERLHFGFLFEICIEDLGALYTRLDGLRHPKTSKLQNIILAAIEDRLGIVELSEELKTTISIEDAIQNLLFLKEANRCKAVYFAQPSRRLLDEYVVGILSGLLGVSSQAFLTGKKEEINKKMQRSFSKWMESSELRREARKILQERELYFESNIKDMQQFPYTGRGLSGFLVAKNEAFQALLQSLNFDKKGKAQIFEAMDIFLSDEDGDHEGQPEACLDPSVEAAEIGADLVEKQKESPFDEAFSWLKVMEEDVLNYCNHYLNPMYVEHLKFDMQQITNEAPVLVKQAKLVLSTIEKLERLVVILSAKSADLIQASDNKKIKIISQILFSNKDRKGLLSLLESLWVDLKDFDYHLLETKAVLGDVGQPWVPFLKDFSLPFFAYLKRTLEWPGISSLVGQDLSNAVDHVLHQLKSVAEKESPREFHSIADRIDQLNGKILTTYHHFLNQVRGLDHGDLPAVLGLGEKVVDNLDPGLQNIEVLTKTLKALGDILNRTTNLAGKDDFHTVTGVCEIMWKALGAGANVLLHTADVPRLLEVKEATEDALKVMAEEVNYFLVDVSIRAGLTERAMGLVNPIAAKYTDQFLTDFNAQLSQLLDVSFPLADYRYQAHLSMLEEILRKRQERSNSLELLEDLMMETLNPQIKSLVELREQMDVLLAPSTTRGFFEWIQQVIQARTNIQVLYDEKESVRLHLIPLEKKLLKAEGKESKVDREIEVLEKKYLALAELNDKCAANVEGKEFSDEEIRFVLNCLNSTKKIEPFLAKFLTSSEFAQKWVSRQLMGVMELMKDKKAEQVTVRNKKEALHAKWQEKRKVLAHCDDLIDELNARINNKEDVCYEAGEIQLNIASWKEISLPIDEFNKIQHALNQCFETCEREIGALGSEIELKKVQYAESNQDLNRRLDDLIEALESLNHISLVGEIIKHLKNLERQENQLEVKAKILKRLSTFEGLLFEVLKGGEEHKEMHQSEGAPGTFLGFVKEEVKDFSEAAWQREYIKILKDNSDKETRELIALIKQKAKGGWFESVFRFLRELFGMPLTKDDQILKISRHFFVNPDFMGHLDLKNTIKNYQEIMQQFLSELSPTIGMVEGEASLQPLVEKSQQENSQEPPDIFDPEFQDIEELNEKERLVEEVQERDSSVNPKSYQIAGM